ncbi:putative MPP superfamily phosphohydrolase [Branchiibius hedensis]|uniref:Predicted phosphohydrolase, MPP superfamily n=1 Tax=Branchiibius hedensis TaxID=672460 RepID=A0A2Y9A1A0_9MICO|nr:metallophosphoesterase [Branchiibius hedensis]PWJ27459.1 putative MPP superfamily phosphohydrolase [Branchiibius hedensis]SSA36269.1 Predicted phosphohydrolase, MPP superfamily [Branchiibius hedensis]
MHPALVTTGSVAGLGAGALIWGTVIERNWYAVRSVTVPVLAPGSSPVRVLQISDLHLVPRQRRRIEWVRSLTRLEPDLVLNTGDNCSDMGAVPFVLEAMEPFLHLPGAFVLGSNDYFAPWFKNPFSYFAERRVTAVDRQPEKLPVDQLVAGLRSEGWVDLRNHRENLKVNGMCLELVGVDDPHIGMDDYAAVAGPPAPDVAGTLGVVHAPYTRVLNAMAADDIPLIIAGHTHGGQVRVPFYGALVTNCDLDTSRASGLSRWWPGAEAGLPAPDDPAYLQVSAGLGHNKYSPVRFACRPEANLITLVPRL